MSYPQKETHSITGIILSGGKSLRMGENKAFIEIGGAPILRRVHTLFKEMFKEVVIVANQKDLFKNYDAIVVEDIVPNRGALGGLYTGLSFSSYPYAFCAACDMPYLKRSVIEFLIRRIFDADVVVPKTEDGLQPLHAVYSKNCLGAIAEVARHKNPKLTGFYPLVKVRVVEEAEFIALDPGRESFININTPEELHSARNGKASV